MNFESQACHPKSIRASSRMSIKIKDSYYTVEFTEEWAVDDYSNMPEERQKLWDVVNKECDGQIQEILEEA